jgi:hypothetical protein
MSDTGTEISSSTQPLRIVDQKTMERLFEIVDAHWVSREAIRVPLAGQGAGWVRQLPDGIWEIVLPERGDLEPFLQRLHAALPPPPLDE